MWIHLLILELIDGAGGTPRPPTPVQAPAGGSHNRRVIPLVIVEIEGVEYRVPLSELEEFLAKYRKEVKKKAKKLVQDKPSIVEKEEVAPVIVRQVIDADIQLVERKVNDSNDKVFAIFDGVIRRKIYDNLKAKETRLRQEEEILLLLL